MKRMNSGLYYCFLAAMIGLPMATNAEIARWNSSRSYADAYRQVTAQRQGTQQPTETGAATKAATAAAELPVRVADTNLANKIAAGESGTEVNMDTLQQCALIYPDAKFEWITPTLGVLAGTKPMCTAIVELYAFGAGKNGENVVVARGNLAAGDAFKCNISEFKPELWLPAAGTVVFPTDNEPTLEDVTEVMNQEQKQGMGLKIAAGTVLAGVAGNILGDNEPGKDGLFGGGKSKVISTLTAALGGGAIMATSALTGKVAGDMIESAAVNAMMGAVVGNIATSSREVVRIEKCRDGSGTVTDCLIGYILEYDNIDTDTHGIFVRENDAEAFLICEYATGSDCPTNIGTCYKDCTSKRVHVNNSTFEVGDGKEYVTNNYTIKQMAADKFSKIDDQYKYVYRDYKMISKGDAGDVGGEEKIYVMVNHGVTPVKSIKPAAIFGYGDKAFGIKEDNWKSHAGSKQVCLFDKATGEVHDCKSGILDQFEPETVTSSDGEVIDMQNKARIGTTLTGAGAGAGLGAFSAHQGAKNEIQERWTAAVREYKDSLQKFYCWSGNRFLAFYNDTVIVPTMTANMETIEQQ